jgi:hypothetical protein
MFSANKSFPGITTVDGDPGCRRTAATDPRSMENPHLPAFRVRLDVCKEDWIACLESKCTAEPQIS